MFNNFDANGFKQKDIDQNIEQPPKLKPIENLSFEAENEAPSMETLNPMNIIPNNIEMQNINEDINILNNYDNNVSFNNENNSNQSIIDKHNLNIDKQDNNLINNLDEYSDRKDKGNNNLIDNDEFINILSNISLDIPSVTQNNNQKKEEKQQSKISEDFEETSQEQTNILEENDKIELDEPYEIDEKLSYEQKVLKIKNIINELNDNKIKVEEFDFEETYQLVIKIEK